MVAAVDGHVGTVDRGRVAAAEDVAHANDVAAVYGDRRRAVEGHSVAAAIDALDGIAARAGRLRGAVDVHRDGASDSTADVAAAVYAAVHAATVNLHIVGTGLILARAAIDAALHCAAVSCTVRGDAAADTTHCAAHQVDVGGSRSITKRSATIHAAFHIGFVGNGYIGASGYGTRRT